MRTRYKVKEINKTKLKSYLKGKDNNNTKNERNTRHRTSSTR